MRVPCVKVYTRSLLVPQGAEPSAEASRVQCVRGPETKGVPPDPGDPASVGDAPSASASAVAAASVTRRCRMDRTSLLLCCRPNGLASARQGGGGRGGSGG